MLGAVALTLAERSLSAEDEQQRPASCSTWRTASRWSRSSTARITIVPSTVGKVIPDGTPEQEWEWCVAGLREIREHANAAGVG